jgi:polysaccharide pyruvyl transferase WcaK-like protein
MPIALIVGAFGQDNPGDEALLEASVLAVRGRPGWEPLVATARPAVTAAQLDVATLPATAAATMVAGARADALVVGGGTVFKELHVSSGRQPGALLRRAVGLTRAFAARRRPVAMIGVGAAEILHPANRQMARSIARSAALLVLRDAESAGLLVGMGVPGPLRVGADLAWLASAPPESKPGLDVAPIGVAVSHLAGDEGLIDRLVHALRPIVQAGRTVELEPWQGSPRLGPDGRIAVHIARELGDGATVVPPPADLAEAIQRMAGRSALVAMRFHAAVAAAEAGTPFAAVAHEPKLAAIAARTGQATIEVDDPAPIITAILELTMVGPPPDAAAVAEEHRRAEATADLLGLVLSGDGNAGSLAHLDLVPEPLPA